MIGGEGEANPIWMTQGQWIKFAAYYGALCVMLEHRYYGDSHPTELVLVPFVFVPSMLSLCGIIKSIVCLTAMMKVLTCLIEALHNFFL